MFKAPAPKSDTLLASAGTTSLMSWSITCFVNSAGVMPSEQELTEMGKFNEELVQAGIVEHDLFAPEQILDLDAPDLRDGDFARQQVVVGGHREHGEARVGGELGELARSIDTMASSLEKQAKEREQVEQTLLNRTHQQTVVAALGQFAMISNDFSELLNQAVNFVAQTLEIEYCGILEMDADGRALPPGETSAKQVFHRLAHTWRIWGERYGYFDSPADAQAFYEDRATRRLHEHGDFRSARAVFEFRGEIVTVPAEKGDVRNLTQSPGVSDRDPVWSPDHGRIAWFSDEGGEYHIVVADQQVDLFRTDGAFVARDFDAASRDDLRPAMGRFIDDFTEFFLGFLQLPRAFHESPVYA